jgi:hypothetical protein
MQSSRKESLRAVVLKNLDIAIFFETDDSSLRDVCHAPVADILRISQGT